MAGKALKIAHFTEAPGGGVSACIEELVREQILDPAIAAIEIVGPRDDLKCFADLSSDKLTLRPFDRRGRSLVGLGVVAWEAVRLLCHSRPDIVHVHASIAGAIVRACANFTRMRSRIVFCPHGWSFIRECGSRQQKIAVLVERALAGSCAAIICVSESEREAALRIGVPGDLCGVIPNGVRQLSIARKQNIEDENAPLRILFVGRFDNQKGFDIYLQTLEQLDGRAEGLAIGDFVVESGIKQNIPPNVQLLGWQARDVVSEYLLRADVLLMPSRWEGMPIAAIEAMRAGVPVFGSRAGGLPEIVQDGVNGRLFDLDDQNAAVRLLEATTRQELVLMGRNARQYYLSHCTSAAMATQVLQIYQQIAARVGRRRTTRSRLLKKLSLIGPFRTLHRQRLARVPPTTQSHTGCKAKP